MHAFPNRIRALRGKLSQQALADRIGCSKMQISDLERGEIQLTLDWMRKIGGALGVAPSDLLNPEDNPDRLADDERRLVANYRAAGEEQRENIQRVTEALSPFRQQTAA